MYACMFLLHVNMLCIYCKHYALAIHCKNCHANKAHIELNWIERELWGGGGGGGHDVSSTARVYQKTGDGRWLNPNGHHIIYYTTQTDSAANELACLTFE